MSLKSDEKKYLKLTKNARDAQNRLLSHILKDSFQSFHIAVGNGNFMNAVAAGDEGKPCVVILHGWGAGLGFFAKNVNNLAINYRVYLLDWLGCGASSRPKFPKNKSVEDAEAFFLPQLHQALTHIQNLESSSSSSSSGALKFHIMAHSLGGYLAGVYSIQHPEMVKHLLLVSPAGMSIQGFPVRELLHDAPWTYKLLYQTYVALWNTNWTPMRLVRLSTPSRGRKLARSYVFGRMGQLQQKEKNLMAEYLFQIARLPGSGEFAAMVILYPDTSAKDPLAERLVNLDHTVDISFLYGDNDWMNSNGAKLAIANLTHNRAYLQIVENSGHHLYLDNPDAFNRISNFYISQAELLAVAS